MQLMLFSVALICVTFYLHFGVLKILCFLSVTNFLLYKYAYVENRFPSFFCYFPVVFMMIGLVMFNGNVIRLWDESNVFLSTFNPVRRRQLQSSLPARHGTRLWSQTVIIPSSRTSRSGLVSHSNLIVGF